MEEKLLLVGRRIKFLRIERRLTQTGLAERLGISQTHLSNVESGKSVVTLKTLFKLAQALDCKMADFFADCDKQDAEREVTVEDAMKLLRIIKGIK